jgi:hypothetical protein
MISSKLLSSIIDIIYTPNKDFFQTIKCAVGNLVSSDEIVTEIGDNS